MNLKRQLLIVGLLTLMLPWASCEFIRQTESALRSGQQSFLASAARAHAGQLSQFVEEFPTNSQGNKDSESLFLHELQRQPVIDGYFDDWVLNPNSLRTLGGTDGLIHYIAATHENDVFIFVEVSDRNVVYANSETNLPDEGPRYADHVSLISNDPPYRRETFVFSAEAPGAIVSFRREQPDRPAPAIDAHWQDSPGGYRVEARLPKSILGTHLGLLVSNTSDASQRGTRAKTYSGAEPDPVVEASPVLAAIAATIVGEQDNTRVLVTDVNGWRVAMAGQLSIPRSESAVGTGWTRRIYDLVVEPGTAARFADPDPFGRERQPYVQDALNGEVRAAWFRSDEDGRAIVAVAAPVMNGSEVIGAVILQQGTDAILSLTNEGLTRLIRLTLLASLLVAGALLGYATWLSRRVRRLSLAAGEALDDDRVHADLPSSRASDEIGDLSRSFSQVLRQLGDYNAYLRSLASKLSHELRTPLAIVSSSLENLEHEPLNDASADYTRRAREGTDRLRRILTAMSEASRVEELLAGSDAEDFDLVAVLASTATAYRDIYPQRCIEFSTSLDHAATTGSPELFIQMLDKLISNAVDFSDNGDRIDIDLDATDDGFLLRVSNPGPPLPDTMRTQLFDSMVSVRSGDDSDHLGLGLYVARLIVEGHGGRISADNTPDGAVFAVRMPHQDSR
jgi:dedicated sortase system histidine kinase